MDHRVFENQTMLIGFVWVRRNCVVHYGFLEWLHCINIVPMVKGLRDLFENAYPDDVQRILCLLLKRLSSIYWNWCWGSGNVLEYTVCACVVFVHTFFSVCLAFDSACVLYYVSNSIHIYHDLEMCCLVYT